MSLFAIADTHLSLSADKPMDIFNGWSDYVQRLEKIGGLLSRTATRWLSQAMCRGRCRSRALRKILLFSTRSPAKNTHEGQS